jgi:hypothetical protein
VRLVFLSQRELDVDRSEQSEDVSLENGYENLEEREDESEHESARTEEFEGTFCVKEEELSCSEAQNEQKVSGDHVHE